MTKQNDSMELPVALKLENAMMLCAQPLLWTAYAQWCFNTWRAQYATWQKNGSKGVFVPAMPRKMECLNFLVGDSCLDIRQRVREFGIPAQLMNIAWVMVDVGRPGLQFSFLVPGPQWEMADSILARWATTNTYAILSPSGKLRRYTFDKPWGVPAKARSWDEWVINGLFGRALNRSKPVKMAKHDAKRKK